MNVTPLQNPLSHPLPMLQQMGALLQPNQMIISRFLDMISNPSLLITPPDSSPESRASNSSSSSSSGTPKRRKKCASTFCRMCDKDISPPSGKKNQGPLRHVRQVHMNGDRVYECRFCDFSAHYDKTHVITHIRRHHPKETASNANVVDHSKSFEKKTKELIGKCFKRSDETSPTSSRPFSTDFSIDSMLNKSDEK